MTAVGSRLDLRHRLARGWPRPVRDTGLGRRLLLPGLGLGLVGAALAGVVLGAFDATPSQVWGVLTDRAGITDGAVADQLLADVIWQIRIPRVLLAVVVGASLGCAGATMQGTFANPLAEPGIVGVSSGAVLGAVAQIVTGWSPFGTWTLPAAAFVGGVVAVLAVYVSARSDGRTEIVTLILTGVATNALLGAVIGLATYVSDDDELRSITFWTLGSVAQATWSKVAVVAPLAAVGIVVAVAASRRLDLLALGDGPARHLGLRVEQFRVVLLTVTAVLTAAAVAVSGIVLFVGLVVPHLVRMVAGPAHRMVLAGSVLGGAIVVVVADLAARTLVAPAELPLGVLTSLVGSPFFFWQLRRTRSRQGGWA